MKIKYWIRLQHIPWEIYVAHNAQILFTIEKPFR